jgi:hypothetical protein
MSGFGTLQQKDLPYATYCQSFDCSKITINFDFDKCWPIFMLLLKNPTVTIELSGSISTATGGPLDITSNLYSTLSGTISTTIASDQVTGNGTAFTTELVAGDYIMLNDYLYRVYSIQSDTAITLTSFAYAAVSITNGHIIHFSYDVTPSFFGWTTTTMPEGEYSFTIKYSYNSVMETYTLIDTSTVLVYCDKYCCVYNKLADLADICDDCITQDNIKKIVEALFMWGLLESYKGSAGCGDSISLNALQARLDRYCDYQPCTTC